MAFLKEYSGLIKYRVEDNAIKEYSGQIIYRIDGYLSKTEIMALLSILFL